MDSKQNKVADCEDSRHQFSSSDCDLKCEVFRKQTTTVSELVKSLNGSDRATIFDTQLKKFQLADDGFYHRFIEKRIGKVKKLLHFQPTNRHLRLNAEDFLNANQQIIQSHYSKETVGNSKFTIEDEVAFDRLRRQICGNQLGNHEDEVFSIGDDEEMDREGTVVGYPCGDNIKGNQPPLKNEYRRQNIIYNGGTCDKLNDQKHRLQKCSANSNKELISKDNRICSQNPADRRLPFDNTRSKHIFPGSQNQVFQSISGKSQITTNFSCTLAKQQRLLHTPARNDAAPSSTNENLSDFFISTTDQDNELLLTANSLDARTRKENFHQPAAESLNINTVTENEAPLLKQGNREQPESYKRNQKDVISKSPSKFMIPTNVPPSGNDKLIPRRSGMTNQRQILPENASKSVTNEKPTFFNNSIKSQTHSNPSESSVQEAQQLKPNDTRNQSQVPDSNLLHNRALTSVRQNNQLNKSAINEKLNQTTDNGDYFKRQSRGFSQVPVNQGNDFRKACKWDQNNSFTCNDNHNYIEESSIDRENPLLKSNISRNQKHLSDSNVANIHAPLGCVRTSINQKDEHTTAMNQRSSDINTRESLTDFTLRSMDQDSQWPKSSSNSGQKEPLKNISHQNCTYYNQLLQSGDDDEEKMLRRSASNRIQSIFNMRNSKDMAWNNMNHMQSLTKSSNAMIEHNNQMIRSSNNNNPIVVHQSRVSSDFPNEAEDQYLTSIRSRDQNVPPDSIMAQGQKNNERNLTGFLTAAEELVLQNSSKGNCKTSSKFRGGLLNYGAKEKPLAARRNVWAPFVSPLADEQRKPNNPSIHPNATHSTKQVNAPGQINRVSSSSNYSNSTKTPNSVDSTEGFKSANAELPLDDERLRNIEPLMVERILNEIVHKIKPIDWNDVAGLEYAKSIIREAVVWPLLRPDIFTGLRRPPRGILLFGPPGTGKTLIGKCIASQSKSTFFSISASSLTSKWVGEGEKMVRALFAVAAVKQPSVIFIDEIDSLLISRSDEETESSRRIKTEFLVQLDGANTNEDDRVLIVGATNRPHELDEAARRRLVRRLYIPLPELPARSKILNNLLLSVRNSVSTDDILEVSGHTEGFSGADMESLCREAAMEPIRSIPFDELEHFCESNVRPVTIEDFRIALQKVRPSVSQKDLDIYVEWNKTYGSGQ